MVLMIGTQLYGLRAPISLRFSRPSFSENSVNQIRVKKQQRGPILASCSKQAFVLFDREQERAALEAHLESLPTTILLLLGPVSCGKTALLKEVLCNTKVSKFPPSYFDARSKKLSDPSVLVTHLQDEGVVAVQWMSTFIRNFANSSFGKVVSFVAVADKANGNTWTISFNKVLEAFLRKEDQDITDVINVYHEMLMLYKTDKPVGSSWPIICIDEVNTLTAWNDGNEEKREDLKALLRFFVMVTKAEKLAHVVLATSDYSFLNWLAKRIGYGFFTPQVIGDFPEDEAFRFFKEYALPLAGRDSELSSDDWMLVYEVCGGNPGQLLSAASFYRGVWDEALEDISNPLLSHVESGLSALNPWTVEQYKIALRQLLASKFGAVRRSVLLSELGDNADGENALNAMVKANLLSFRPKSRWARDLPAEVYGRGEAVITAPTPGHFFCIKILDGRGLLAVQKVE